MKKVLAISCGMNKAKDRSVFGKRSLYLNYGLLGLCTLLREKGYDVKQFQGEFYSPSELIGIINKTDHALSQIEYPVLISIISFYSLDWCRELATVLKKEYGKKIILGGKYVIDGNIEWLMKKIPDVDVFLDGAGELKIEEALHTLKNTKQEFFDCYSKLNYTLLYDYKKYNPVIELSRGCGHGCIFCADRNRKPCRMKSIPEVIKEIENLDIQYEYQDYSLYFQMPTFSPNGKWIQSIKTEKKLRKASHYWRCTTRVDSIKSEYLPILAESGLKVIDLGLESASPMQLLNMGKTNSPTQYLEMADELIHTANTCDVWIKLNILLSAGETYKTIEETIQWLKERKKLVKGVSVNCETIFGPNNRMMDQIKLLGASYVDGDDLINNGYASINLSPEINYSEAQKIKLYISRMMMSADDYYDLKKIGYFSRFYSRKDFYNDISKDMSYIPFGLDR